MFLYLWSFMLNVFLIFNYKYCKLLDLIVGLVYFKDFFFIYLSIFFLWIDFLLMGIIYCLYLRWYSLVVIDIFLVVYVVLIWGWMV